MEAKEIKLKLETLLKDARTAEQTAQGKYAAKFAEQRAARVEIDKAAAILAAANSKFRKLNEELAPVIQETAPFIRRRNEIERAVAAFKVQESFATVGIGLDVFALVPQRATVWPSLHTEVVKYARGLKDTDGNPAMGADAHKFTKKVVNAIRTEFALCAEVLKAEGLTA